MKAVQEPWFETERIRDDLYCITEPYYTWDNRANLWLIRGRDADLLVAQLRIEEHVDAEGLAERLVDLHHRRRLGKVETDRLG